MKLKEAYLIYLKKYCENFQSKKSDLTLFKNNVLPIIKLYKKYKQYFNEEMKAIMDFVLFSFLERKSIDKKVENMLLYYQAIERSLK